MILPEWTKLSLREQIGQMVVVRASGYLFDHQIRYPAWEATTQQLDRWFEELNLGGVILLGGSAAELAYRTQQLQQRSKIPLLIAADIEEGVGQRFAGATWFPPPMALGKIATSHLEQATNYAWAMGQITAQEALAIGINWILAPIVDVNNNPRNPVINVRSFGDRPAIVSQLATAFIQGAHSYPILTTAKHFPGHGNTATDSHLDLPVIPHPEARLQEIELPPFQAAIQAGVDAVMTAHLLIPAWDGQYPATLSHPILTGQLRDKLGFEGLIVTDALIMDGIAKYAPPGEIAVKAIAAGADILLMPSEPELAIKAVEQAVNSGELSPQRIAASVKRIWQAKQKLRPVSVCPPLSFDFQPESFAQVRQILEQTTLTGGNLPCKPSPEGRNLLVTDDLLNCDFLDRQTPAVTLPETCGYQLQLFDRRNLHLANHDPRPTLLQVFIRGNPFRGSAGLNSTAQEVYGYLLANGVIEGLIIYGSPYVLDWFLPLLPPELPWVFSYGQMPQAQASACQILFGLSRNNNMMAGNFL
jgi:beta-glucosidase